MYAFRAHPWVVTGILDEIIEAFGEDICRRAYACIYAHKPSEPMVLNLFGPKSTPLAMRQAMEPYTHVEQEVLIALNPAAELQLMLLQPPEADPIQIYQPEVFLAWVQAHLDEPEPQYLPWTPKET